LWTSSCFFRNCTDLTPVRTPVTVALADPSVGSVVAESTTTLPCPAAPSGFLTGYYTPSFSRNMVGVSHLHDLGVVTTFPLHEPVASCTIRATGVPLATFHREPGSGLYSLHFGSHHTGSGQVRSVEVAVDSGAARGAEPAGAGSRGAESRGAEPGGAETGGAESGGAEPGGAESGGAEPGGAEPGGAEPGGAGSAHWFARRWSRAAGAGGTTVAAGPGGARTGGTGAAGTGGAAAAAGVGPAGGTAGATGGTGAAGPAGVGAAGASGAPGAGAAAGVGAGGSTDAGTSAGAGVGAVGARGAAGAGATAGGTGAIPVGSGGPARPRPYFIPLLEQVLGLPPSTGPAPPFECPQPVQSQSQLQPVSPLPAPSPYTGPTGGLAERREPASHPASPVRNARTSRRAPRPRPPAVPGTHQMALRPSTAPLRVPLPSPPESSLPVLANPESDSLRAASPTVARLLSTVVTDPSFESTAASALSVCPPYVGGECALSTDVLEDRQEEFQCFAAALPHLMSTLIAPEGDPDAPDISTPRSYAEAIEGPYSSQWQSAMDAEMAS
ncbi:unnamed protein product, partial [Closterium sp. NIES-53]